ncbi:MAG: hypothetical protein HY906_16300 [Deltaproteobacteria bacterium]|nr:hypothetical protein [Deltaproteobacteria bacterium]
MGLDIGCGNYNIVQNNLVASYAVFNDRVADPGYTAIDLSRYGAFSPSEISGFSRARCVDGIALSGNYLSLVFDNEVTDCTGDLVLSYDHGPMHNSVYGHQQNLFFRNYFHDNAAYWIIREYDKQTGGVSYDELFFNNVLAKNGASARFSFEHSVGLMLVNNTVVDNGPLALAEQSTGALIANNIFYSSILSVAADSTGAQVATNYQGAAAILFVDYQGGDYHVAAQTGSACIDTGTNLSSALDAVFAAVAAHMGEYAFYPDFDLAFDFYRDRDGNLQDAGWDLGAYSQPR